MDWDEYYQKGEVFWDKGAPAPALRQYLECHAVSGRALVPGCGRGHEVAVAVAHGLDATGLDIAPTGVAEARALYPQFAERFVTGDLFDPPAELRGAFDVVLEHTCMSALPPTMRADYRRGIDLTLRRGGLLIGVWFLIQLFNAGSVAAVQTGGVAYLAHVGGFIFGAVFGRLFVDPDRNGTSESV